MSKRNVYFLSKSEIAITVLSKLLYSNLLPTKDYKEIIFFHNKVLKMVLSMNKLKNEFDETGFITRIPWIRLLDNIMNHNFTLKDLKFK